MAFLERTAFGHSVLYPSFGGDSPAHGGLCGETWDVLAALILVPPLAQHSVVDCTLNDLMVGCWIRINTNRLPCYCIW